MRFWVAYLFVVKRVTVFLMVSFVATSAMAEDVWVNKEGKRPWIDLPYKDWPIFKEDNPKLIKKEVAYIDTGVEEKEKWKYLKWLDNSRILITNDNRIKSQERGGRDSTDMYDMNTKVLTRISDHAALVYINRKNGLIDAIIADPDYKKENTYLQYKVDTNGVINIHQKIDDNKKLYLYSDSANACWDAFQPLEGFRYKYIDGTDCKSYFITGKPADYKINQDGKTIFRTDSAISLVDENGQEKKIFYDGLPLEHGTLSGGLDYVSFLDAYYTAFYRSSNTEKLEDKTLFLIISKQGDVEDIKYPIELMKKIKANIDWIDGAEPIPSGLVLNTNKGSYLITPYEIKILKGIPLPTNIKT
ncbi:MAG: hypothetical protein IPP76_13570 [Moraxellaceae bacterium]|nr:hypothetical protein [Moraxellaceae bacterium]